jgi:ubiquinol oxidase
MESLGGNSLWSDRFLGYHLAILYYWFLNLVFLGSPRVAYQFMELLEAHAVDTYDTFARTNRKRLSELPAPSGERCINVVCFSNACTSLLHSAAAAGLF